MSQIRGIVFDLGNVLVDYRRQDIITALVDLCEVDEKAIEAFVAPKMRDLFTGAIDLGQLQSLAESAFAVKTDKEGFHQAFCCGLYRDEAAMSYLAWLREVCQVRFGVISNITDGHDQWVYRNMPEIEDFDVVTFSNEVGLSKPEPEIYQHTAAELGLSGHELIFIDDLAENVAAAQALGWHAIQHRAWSETVSELERLLGRPLTCHEQ